MRQGVLRSSAVQPGLTKRRLLSLCQPKLNGQNKIFGYINNVPLLSDRHTEQVQSLN